MRSDDDAARTTQEFNPLRAHGRRQEDQVLAGWTWGKVARIAGALLALGTLATGAINFTLAKIATRQEVTQATERITDSVSAVSHRVSSLEVRVARSDSASASDRQLLRGIARVLCFNTDAATATLAELPCTQLGITSQVRRLR